MASMVTCAHSAVTALSSAAVGKTLIRRVRRRKSNDGIAAYAYDGLNRRVVKKKYTSSTLSETRHFYYSNAWQVLEERVDSHPTISERQFFWGARYVDDLASRDRDSNFDGTIDDRRYALQDDNWNMMTFCDTAGGLYERFRYDAYGAPTLLDSVFALKTTADVTEWETLYASYRWDSDTGLYHVRNRYCHSTLGRWLTRDPYQPPHGLNLYEYVRSWPLNAVDPLGLQEVCCGMEVGPYLSEGLRKLRTKFDSLSDSARLNACSSMVSTSGWDIFEFFQAGGGGAGTNAFLAPPCGAGQCVGTITVRGNCYWAADVNYILWGAARRMCAAFYTSKYGMYAVHAGERTYYYYNVPWDFDFQEWSLENTLSWVKLYRPLSYIDPSRRVPKSGTLAGRLAWSEVGWTGNYARAAGQNVNNQCPPCATRYNGILQMYFGRRGSWIDKLDPFGGRARRGRRYLVGGESQIAIVYVGPGDIIRGIDE